ncbi:uncharacterized mitochondrial protein AtMg00810-like [Vigna umbellata]|uniref:uncharacterized mitochondrial protein AtMg00810-like n=1 Tax=Vigna umbellata TaxID=87088 RepID=UPI001F5E4161|nr:uncharacterized mitochondrial protein AtMg00810-like [Vigna umbellata]
MKSTSCIKHFTGCDKLPGHGTKGLMLFISHGFERCAVEHSLYVKKSDGDNIMIFCLYVDDLLVTGSSLSKIEEFKQMMEAEFEMTDLGKLSYFLGMEFSQTTAGLLMHKKMYVKDLLERFKMVQCNDVKNPLEINAKLKLDEDKESVDGTAYKQLVGSLRFLCNSKPDLMFGVGLISRFMSNPKISHMAAAKRILRYVKGTADYGILFPYGTKEEELKLVGYTDSDFGGDQIERKSTSGNIYFINRAPISWSSKKQTVITLSSCETEYIAGCYAVCLGVWLNEVSKELKVQTDRPVELKMDNTSAISLAKNPVSHGRRRSKHIEVKYHFLRDMVNKGRFELTHCRTDLQLANMFTKALKLERFEFLKKEIGVLTQSGLN